MQQKLSIDDAQYAKNQQPVDPGQQSPLLHYSQQHNHCRLPLNK
jgi:hypothetical protein